MPTEYALHLSEALCRERGNTSAMKDAGVHMRLEGWMKQLRYIPLHRSRNSIHISCVEDTTCHFRCAVMDSFSFCRNGKRGQGWERKYVVLDAYKVITYEAEPRDGLRTFFLFHSLRIGLVRLETCLFFSVPR